MNRLRQAHLYLGTLFAPLMIYFSVSGAWQIFRWNDLPKDQPPSVVVSVMHELSKPHTNSTLPGLSPKTERSVAFNGLALAMSVGLVATALIGLVMAYRFTRSRTRIVFCFAVGTLLPVILLFLR